MISETKPSPASNAAVSKARSKLRRDFQQWRAFQLASYPQLHDHITLVDSSTTEIQSLKLPSSFTLGQRATLGLDDLAAIEYDLREGQAYDALHEVREAIKTFNYNLAFKKTNIHGQRANTRAQSFLRSLAGDKVSAADKYRRARTALLSLGLREDDKVFQPLYDNQLWMKNVNEPQQLGEKAVVEPWIWIVGGPKGMSKEEEADWSLDSKLDLDFNTWTQ